MNLILLEDDDFIAADRVCLRGRRLRHVLEVHRATVGERLRVGLVGGQLGEAEVLTLDDRQLEMAVRLAEEPPPPLQLTLLLALPRPKMLKRVLQTISAMGVKRLYLINSYRVEKSFWGSPLLQPDRLREQLCLGLEQARDTLLPDVQLRPRFKPFVEDELPAIAAGTAAYVAHPAAGAGCPVATAQPLTLAVGPEGGFIPYEVEMLAACGFAPVSLGPRILRVETAVPVLLARLCSQQDCR